jgi:hypothetical protein
MRHHCDKEEGRLRAVGEITALTWALESATVTLLFVCESNEETSDQTGRSHYGPNG